MTFSFAEVIALFSLGPFRFAFQLFASTHAKSFTQKLPLGKGSGCAVPERPVMPMQYVALALRRVPRIFQDIYMYIYLYPLVRESYFNGIR